LPFRARFLAPEQKTLSAKVIRNSLFSGIRAVLVWPIPFLLIPFILAKIGPRGYGTWAVFLTVISLTSAADLGLSGTLTKHVAEHYAREDFSSLQRLINASLTLYSFIALALIVIVNLASHELIFSFFKGAAIPREELGVMCRYLSFIVGANVLVLPFYSTLTGLQRMDLTNLLGYFSNVTSAVFTVIFLQLGLGLRGLLYSYSISILLSLILHAWVVRVLLPELDFNLFEFDREEIRRIFSFSFQIYLTQIAVAIHTQIDKLYLALFVGVEAAGWYNIAAEAAWKLRYIPSLLLTPVMAAASELDARGEEAKLHELHYRAHKYLALFGVPLTLYVAFASRRLVDLWIGPRLSIVAMPLAVLVLVNFFNLATGPGYLILIGQGILWPGVSSALIGVVVSVTLSLFLVYRYGLTGAVIGTSLAIVVASLFFFYFFGRRVESASGRLIVWAYLKPVIISLVLLALLFRLKPPRGLGWGGLVSVGIVFGMLYFTALVATGFFDRVDLARAKTVFQSLPLARRIIPDA